MLLKNSYSATTASPFLNPSPTQLKVSKTTWSWNEFTVSACQLPDGTYGLTYRQMAGKVRLPKESAKKFVEERSLPSIQCQLNSNFEAIICPLNVAASYWKYVEETTNCSVARAGWIAVENYLNCPQPTQLTNQIQLANTVYHLSVLPKPNSPKLQILVVGSKEWEEYRISIKSALILIGISPDWLEKVQSKYRTRAELIKKGFCGQLKEYYIKEGTDVKPVSTIGILDCLAIWEYFSYKGCTPAIAGLKALAIEPLERRIEKMKYAEKVAG